MPIEELINLIEDRLKNQHPGGATLKVLRDQIRHEEDWWYVPVLPDKQMPSRFEYYETLANIETQLEMDDHVTVLFIPVAPGEA